MSDMSKTKAQLIEELTLLRARKKESEKAEAEHRKKDEGEQCAAAVIHAAGRKRVEEALRRQNELLHNLSARLSEVEETERKRLADELHHVVGQSLTTLSINLSIVQNMLPADAPSEVYSRLQDSLSIVDALTEDIRHVISDLRPSILDDFGLAAALRWYGDIFMKRSGIHVTVQVDESYAGLPPHIENTLFRIFQEALTNVWKHATASEVTVSIEENHAVHMLINDNGNGFDTAEADSGKEKQGWGLLMMSERARASGCRFSIESCLGKGTQIKLKVKR